MTAIQPRGEPGVATAVQGLVTLDGPNGVAITMTPAAARETGERLIAAADEAVAQGGAEQGGAAGDVAS